MSKCSTGSRRADGSPCNKEITGKWLRIFTLPTEFWGEQMLKIDDDSLASNCSDDRAIALTSEQMLNVIGRRSLDGYKRRASLAVKSFQFWTSKAQYLLLPSDN